MVLLYMRKRKRQCGWLLDGRRVHRSSLAPYGGRSLFVGAWECVAYRWR
jgi:hypothetical protein